MPTARRFDLRRLDVAGLASQSASVEGSLALVELDRLRDCQAADAANGDATVTWRLSGQMATLEGAGRQPSLRVAATTTTVLECQRCLEPMPVRLDVDRRLFFVAGEQAAAELDAESDADVLALAPAIDGRALIEDELLLALPLVPRHAECPQPLSPTDPAAGPADPTDPTEHPFSALAALKSRT